MYCVFCCLPFSPFSISVTITCYINTNAGYISSHRDAERWCEVSLTHEAGHYGSPQSCDHIYNEQWRCKLLLMNIAKRVFTTIPFPLGKWCTHFLIWVRLHAVYSAGFCLIFNNVRRNKKYVWFRWADPTFFFVPTLNIVSISVTNGAKLYCTIHS